VTPAVQRIPELRQLPGKKAVRLNSLRLTPDLTPLTFDKRLAAHKASLGASVRGPVHAE